MFTFASLDAIKGLQGEKAQSAYSLASDTSFIITPVYSAKRYLNIESLASTARKTINNTHQI